MQIMSRYVQVSHLSQTSGTGLSLRHSEAGVKKKTEYIHNHFKVQIYAC